MNFKSRLAHVILQGFAGFGDVPPMEATLELKWPNNVHVNVTINMSEFEAIVISKPETDSPEAPMQAAILEVVQQLKPDERMSGEEIAKRAGYTYGGWFRTCLSAVVKSGKIASFGRYGYGRLQS